MTGAALKTDRRVLKALGWMLLALASFSTVAVSGREAAREASPLEIMFFRCVMSLVAVLIIVMMGPGLRAMRTGVPLLHMFRASAHFVAQYSWLAALTLIPLTQLFALEFTAPLWVALLAPLLLGEQLTRTRMLAAGIGFVGLLIVARPGVIAINAGVVLALVAAVGFAFSMIATKALTRDGPMRILFYMFLIQSLLALLLLLGGVRMLQPATLGWIGGLALAGLLAHYALVRAFSIADAIIVSPMDFLRLPLIAVVGALLYAEPFDPVVLFGGLVVIVGNLVNLWGERPKPAG